MTGPAKRSPRIGSTAQRTVRDLMTTPVYTADATMPVSELRALMRRHRIRHLPVLDDDGTLLGLVSQRDLLARVGLSRDEVTTPLVARRVMTSPVETIDPDTDVRRAAAIMLERKYGCLPVVEGGVVIGILTEADFVRLLSHEGG